MKWFGRSALVAVTVLAVAPPAARASGSCGAAPGFAGMTTGTVAGDGRTWRRTSADGLTVVTLSTTSPTAYLRVYDAACSVELCASPAFGSGGCTVNHTGTIAIEIGNPFSAAAQWVLTATSVPGTTPQCRDGIDNDANTRVDFPEDPGCASPDDPVESSLLPGTGTALPRHDRR